MLIQKVTAVSACPVAQKLKAIAAGLSPNAKEIPARFQLLKQRL
jgi:hypothetical protein